MDCDSGFPVAAEALGLRFQGTRLSRRIDGAGLSLHSQNAGDPASRACETLLGCFFWGGSGGLVLGSLVVTGAGYFVLEPCDFYGLRASEFESLGSNFGCSGACNLEPDLPNMPKNEEHLQRKAKLDSFHSLKQLAGWVLEKRVLYPENTGRVNGSRARFLRLRSSLHVVNSCWQKNKLFNIINSPIRIMTE